MVCLRYDASPGAAPLRGSDGRLRSRKPPRTKTEEWRAARRNHPNGCRGAWTPGGCGRWTICLRHAPVRSSIMVSCQCCAERCRRSQRANCLAKHSASRAGSARVNCSGAQCAVRHNRRVWRAYTSYAGCAASLRNSASAAAVKDGAGGALAAAAPCGAGGLVCMSVGNEVGRGVRRAACKTPSKALGKNIEQHTAAAPLSRRRAPAPEWPRALAVPRPGCGRRRARFGAATGSRYGTARR